MQQPKRFQHSNQTPPSLPQLQDENLQIQQTIQDQQLAPEFHQPVVEIDEIIKQNMTHQATMKQQQEQVREMMIQQNMQKVFNDLCVGVFDELQFHQQLQQTNSLSCLKILILHLIVIAEHAFDQPKQGCIKLKNVMQKIQMYFKQNNVPFDNNMQSVCLDLTQTIFEFHKPTLKKEFNQIFNKSKACVPKEQKQKCEFQIV